MNEVVHHLSNELLIKLLDKRVELERWNEAEIVDYIREVMHRRLWLEFGAASMFDFLTHAHFHYAPAVAQRRIDAARLMQVFPEVKELLREGELNLTQLGMFASAARKKDVPLKVQREILHSVRGHTVRNTQVILNEAFGLEIKKRTTVREQSVGLVDIRFSVINLVSTGILMGEFVVRSINFRWTILSHDGKVAETKSKISSCFVGFTIALNMSGKFVVGHQDNFIGKYVTPLEVCAPSETNPSFS